MHRAIALIVALCGVSSAAMANGYRGAPSLIPVVGRDGQPLMIRVGGKTLHTPNGALDTGQRRMSMVYVNPGLKISTRAGGPAMTVGEWRALGVDVTATQPGTAGRITGLMLVTGARFDARAAARLGLTAARPGQIVGFASPRTGSPASFGTALGRIGGGL